MGAVAAPARSQNMEQQVRFRIRSRDSDQSQTLPGDPPARQQWWYKTGHGYSHSEPWYSISRDQQEGFSLKAAPKGQEGQTLASSFLHDSYCQQRRWPCTPPAELQNSATEPPGRGVLSRPEYCRSSYSYSLAS